MVHPSPVLVAPVKLDCVISYKLYGCRVNVFGYARFLQRDFSRKLIDASCTRALKAQRAIGNQIALPGVPLDESFMVIGGLNSAWNSVHIGGAYIRSGKDSIGEVGADKIPLIDGGCLPCDFVFN